MDSGHDPRVLAFTFQLRGHPAIVGVAKNFVLVQMTAAECQGQGFRHFAEVFLKDATGLTASYDPKATTWKVPLACADSGSTSTALEENWRQ